MAEIMNERQEKEAFRQAVDARLSGLQGDPWLTQRILMRAEGKRQEKPVRPTGVRRKMSLGLVLALVLTLLSVSAVAAVAVYLSFQQIVEEEALPRANEVEGDSFTAEDTNFIVQLAEENGLVLSENAYASINKFLENGEGYYKEELLMALFKAEYGQNPATWSLETQKWFDDVCVAIGFVEQPQKALPGEGEITLEEAVAIAEDYIHRTYGNEWNINDPTAYELGKQYLSEFDGDYPGRYWTIIYSPLKITSREFWVYLDSRGKVLDDYMRKGVEPGTTLSNLYSRFRDIYGWNDDEWDVEVLRKLVEASQICTPLNDEIQLLTAIQRTTYPAQTGHPVEREAAVNIATEAMGATEYQLFRAICIDASPNPVWRIYFRDDSVEEVLRFVMTEVDSTTGELTFSEARDWMWHWAQTIVTQQQYEEAGEGLEDTSVG